MFVCVLGSLGGLDGVGGDTWKKSRQRSVGFFFPAMRAAPSAASV